MLKFRVGGSTKEENVTGTSTADFGGVPPTRQSKPAMETNETSTAPLTDHGVLDGTQPCLPARQLSKDARKLFSDAEVLSRDNREVSSAHAVLSSEKLLSNGDSENQKRQKRMGPAPFASFEDLSDELESPDDKHLPVVRLPGIREDITPTTPNNKEPKEPPVSAETKLKIDLEDDTAMAQHSGISVIGVITGSTVSSSTPAQSTSKMSIQPPTTPRIDISRASSSSHHDSKDSTPEREIFEGNGEGQSAKLGLGFKEDGAMDLRASTEELDFHDPEEVKKSKSRATSPGPEENYRKDSQCSDIVLLSISGRTSRLSSIGSAGSGQSRLSNASHLSVMSGHSNLSRCSSPHKMLLETSFCGYKSPDTQSLASETGTNIEDEEIEKLLLSRKHDPTQALIAEGVKVEKNKVAPEKPLRKGSESLRNDIRIKVDKPVDSSSEDRSKIPRKIISKSGVEYIYIPLKGPLPLDDSEPEKSKERMSKSAPLKTRSAADSTSRSSKSASQSLKSSSRSKTGTHSKSTSSSRSGSQSKLPSKNVPLVKAEPQKQATTFTKHTPEPKYIRIKLKPDHCYPDEGNRQSTSKPTIQNISKPDSLDLSLPAQEQTSLPQPKPVVTKITPKFEKAAVTSLSNTPCMSPKFDKNKIDQIESVTPSPSISRRSSFASLFKSKEAISPESPTIHGQKKKGALSGILKPGATERSRSRSKSRDRDAVAAVSSNESIDSKSKHKSVLTIFKSSKKDKKSDSDVSSQETIHSLDGLGKLEFKFNEPNKNKREKPLDSDTIRIPLHSPTYYETEHKLEDWKNSSQDSQDTVIEATTRKNVNVVIEAIPSNESTEATEPATVTTNKKLTSRQSSVDSQNVVFSTKIGAENEVFSVKLPKQKTIQQQNSDKEISESTITEAQKTETKKETETKAETKERPKSITEVPKSNKSLEKTSASNSLEHPRSMNESKSVSDNSSKDKRESMLSVVSSKSINLEEERNNSSESERDSELEYPRVKKELELKLEQDPDREAIVLQQDSFEDELPYVPTTLPQERSAAVPIVPIKQRATLEMRTCPIERPRSTTPTHKYIIPSELEGMDRDKSDNIEKLKISLPRHDSVHKRTKSADISDSSKLMCATNVTQTIQSPKSSASVQSPQTTEEPPPPLPPKGVQKSWVNFEDIPEKRKPPKRIQTIPSRGHIDVPDVVLRENVVYTYVDPEECKCECHEQGAKERDRRKQEPQTSAVQEDELPLLEDDGDEKDDKPNLNLKRGDYENQADSRKTESAVSNGVKKDPLPRTSQCSSHELNMMSSHRSGVISQDDLQSPNNAFPKNS